MKGEAHARCFPRVPASPWWTWLSSPSAQCVWSAWTSLWTASSPPYVTTASTASVCSAGTTRREYQSSPPPSQSPLLPFPRIENSHHRKGIIPGVWLCNQDTAVVQRSHGKAFRLLLHFPQFAWESAFLDHLRLDADSKSLWNFSKQHELFLSKSQAENKKKKKKVKLSFEALRLKWSLGLKSCFSPALDVYHLLGFLVSWAVAMHCFRFITLLTAQRPVAIAVTKYGAHVYLQSCFPGQQRPYL